MWTAKSSFQFINNTDNKYIVQLRRYISISIIYWNVPAKSGLLKNTNNAESLSSQKMSKVKSAILSTVHDGAGAVSEGASVTVTAVG